jgi:chromate transporter
MTNSSVPFSEAFRTWVRIGLLSFGGPAGQIAVMHRILVDEKRWIGEARFLHALNYCMLLPGPEAQQLATYVGWLLHRTAGGLAAGLLFVLPGVVAILALSTVYATFGQVGLVAALFFGLKAAVLAVVVQAVQRIGVKALKNRVMLGIAAAAFVAIFFFNLPFPGIILAAGLLGAVGGALRWPPLLVTAGAGQATGLLDRTLDAGVPDHVRPNLRRSLRVATLWLVLWLGPVVVLYATLGGDNVFTTIAVYFSKMAVVTFGGAYAVLAYMAQEAVNQYHWLSQGEMLDGLGMAETTPGPLIMVLQFVGFIAAYRDPGALPPLLAGTLGGLLATWVTFTPCFLWIFLGGPYIEVLRGNRALASGLAAITAAVVGVVFNLAVWFGLHTLFTKTVPTDLPARLGRIDLPVWSSLSPWSLVLLLAAATALFRLRIGMVPTLAACAVAGMALHGLGLVG